MSPPSQHALATRLDVATEAAAAAAAVLQAMQGKLKDVQEKRPGDLVTEADRASEAVILAMLERHFPTDDVLAEESGQVRASENDFCWVIDPLDGTTNFAHSFPAAAVSIGLLWQGQPVAGVIHDIFRQDVFRASRGGGATRNRVPIHVSKTHSLPYSLLVSGFAYDRRETADNNYAEFCHFTHLTQGVRRPGSASLDLAHVAAGWVDGYWERGLSVWDIAAGIILVEEAGGQVTAYDGGPVEIYQGRLLASNGLIHVAMQQELARVKPLPQMFPTEPLRSANAI